MSSSSLLGIFVNTALLLGEKLKFAKDCLVTKLFTLVFGQQFPKLILLLPIN